MSYEEYKRAMEKKRKAAKKQDDLPEAFLKLFEKHNVEAPLSAARPQMEEEILPEEVYEEEIISEECIYEPFEEFFIQQYVKGCLIEDLRNNPNRGTYSIEIIEE